MRLRGQIERSRFRHEADLIDEPFVLTLVGAAKRIPWPVAEVVVSVCHLQSVLDEHTAKRQ